ncbi:manganese efflux pump MntP family protein [Lentisphaerota bacterium ZTH]|nr:manganese efflux pump [Lentisphaerota bacterium]WET07595.1 manganese efflux pump MntP family protein [Lentisphaerota bacterium ZTH]
MLNYFDLTVIAVGVSLDAFAVAACWGASCRKKVATSALKTALSFGFFQALMPVLGWFALFRAADVISVWVPWIVLILLGGIGCKMIWEAVQARKDGITPVPAIGFKMLIIAGLAVSLDALGVGVSLALTKGPLLTAIAMMGGFTFIISFAGYVLGRFFGHLFERNIEIIGGVAIILIGCKIFIEQMFF